MGEAWARIQRGWAGATSCLDKFIWEQTRINFVDPCHPSSWAGINARATCWLDSFTRVGHWRASEPVAWGATSCLDKFIWEQTRINFVDPCHPSLIHATRRVGQA